MTAAADRRYLPSEYDEHTDAILAKLLELADPGGTEPERLVRAAFALLDQADCTRLYEAACELRRVTYSGRTLSQPHELFSACAECGDYERVGRRKGCPHCQAVGLFEEASGG